MRPTIGGGIEPFTDDQSILEYSGLSSGVGFGSASPQTVPDATFTAVVFDPLISTISTPSRMAIGAAAGPANTSLDVMVRGFYLMSFFMVFDSVNAVGFRGMEVTYNYNANMGVTVGMRNSGAEHNWAFNPGLRGIAQPVYLAPKTSDGIASIIVMCYHNAGVPLDIIASTLILLPAFDL